MSQPPIAHPLSYRDSGVDIDAGNELVRRIKPLAQRTARPEQLDGLGGFGALFAMPKGYRDPVLVSGTDGVGTKLKLAQQLQRHEHIGIDLVAMCVNDILVSGAEPLFFLDYFACGKLDLHVAETVIAGIAEGCRQAGCALVGGETAEMPGFYPAGEYDLAGFAVGVVERSRILQPDQVQIGDCLLALASTGPHSNGYSLIRKLIELTGTPLDSPMQNGQPLGDALMRPTRIYVRPVLELLRTLPVKALSHITGGGLLENPPRVLPKDVVAWIDESTWEWPEVFHWIATQGQVERAEMRRTLNCGVGMLVCVAQEHCEEALSLLRQQGEEAWMIGEIRPGLGEAVVQFSGDAQ